MENQQTTTPVESTPAEAVSTSNSNTSTSASSSHHSSHHHSSHHHSSHHHHHHHHSSSHKHRHSSHRRHSFLHRLFSGKSSSSSKKHSQDNVKSYTISFLLLISVLVAFFPDGLLKRLIGGKSASGMAFEDIFTYFKPTGTGSTNFGSLFLTAVCIVLLVMSIIQLTRKRSFILKRMLSIVSVIALIIALMPLILDVSSLSITGMFIALLLAFVFWLSCKNPFEKK